MAPLSNRINHFAKLSEAAAENSIVIDLPLSGSASSSTLTIRAVVGGKVIDKEKVNRAETVDHAARRLHGRMREHKLVE
jgi:hypothetical protein